MERTAAPKAARLRSVCLCASLVLLLGLPQQARATQFMPAGYGLTVIFEIISVNGANYNSYTGARNTTGQTAYDLHLTFYTHGSTGFEFTRDPVNVDLVPPVPSGATYTFPAPIQGSGKMPELVSGFWTSAPPDHSPIIPEPATWTMMLVGFGVAGYVMRTRKPAVRFD